MVKQLANYQWLANLTDFNDMFKRHKPSVYFGYRSSLATVLHDLKVLLKTSNP